uniref:Uncharacterized protein n=1 Tax=Lepeophtheirus salmonis TaxID=72036 RepID=A0A0K2T6Q0_LEPSM
MALAIDRVDENYFVPGPALVTVEPLFVQYEPKEYWKIFLVTFDAFSLPDSKNV